LTSEPLPLFSERNGIALLWSAKAASTFAVKWMYFQEGVLDEAMAYSRWPHHYRRHVWYKRPGHRDLVQSIPELGPRAIKFVRDPYERVVSSYLSYVHQLQRRPRLQHLPMLWSIGWYLRRPIGGRRSFSFREFVGFLGTLDLETANIHVRVQTHPCERLGMLPEMSIVRAEESAEVLPRLEDELGLCRSDARRLGRSGHHSHREVVDAFVGDTVFHEVMTKPVPTSASFYDADLAAAVARLYHEDIARYGYEPPSA
jgi:hypothetical protein